jgi:hypothetical protein
MSHGRHRRNFLRTALGAAGYLAFAGCGGGGGNASPAADAPAASADSAAPGLFPLSAAAISALRSAPQSFLSAYGALGGSSGSSTAYVQSQLGAPFASLSDAGCMAAFACQVANSCASFGNTALAPLSATLGELLSSQVLACGHFCKLATLLTLLGHPEVIPPDAAASSPAKATVHVLVWLGNVPLATGYHAQLIMTNVLDDAYLLLDPTFGLVLRVPFVGAGPQAGLPVVESATTMMQTPIAQDNLVLLNPAATAGWQQMLSTLLGGGVGPQYVDYDPVYGSLGWDAEIAQIFDGMGVPPVLSAPTLPQR